jgi:membrane-associated phospholipid phosphatase
MSSPVKLYYNNFKIAAIISGLISLSILSLSRYFGKNQFFLMLNGNLGTLADYFFQYFTHLGDALFWTAWLLWILIKKQKPILPLLLSSFLIDTMITQMAKHVIYSNALRPLQAVKDGSFIHYVEGVTVHSINSFPSGHTATAFTFMLLISLTMKNSVWMYLSILVALLVGYSRIYLGQHFPFDVGGGIIVAITSVSIATYVQKWYDKRELDKGKGINFQ